MLDVAQLRIGPIGPVDLQVAPGECVVITGASGSGKSRLLRAIADLDPNDGEVKWRGTPRSTLPAPDWRRQVGYLPAESGWWADKVDSHFPHGAGGEDLSALGLPTDALGWAVTRLSTGEKQRLALARLLAGAPDVLLLDEPTSALDEENTSLVETVLRTRLKDGAAILLVSHNRTRADRLADRRLDLRDGALLEVGNG